MPVTPTGSALTVSFLTVDQGNFEDVRFTKYLQAVSDAQEPFRRAMAEALASGFGKENIRKQLQRGLVFETGLAPPAVDIIEPAAQAAELHAAGRRRSQLWQVAAPTASRCAGAACCSRRWPPARWRPGRRARRRAAPAMRCSSATPRTTRARRTCRRR